MTPQLRPPHSWIFQPLPLQVFGQESVFLIVQGVLQPPLPHWLQERPQLEPGSSLRKVCLQSPWCQRDPEGYRNFVFFLVKVIEIMTNGPVQATFMVYSSFESYKSGVYKRVPGDRPLGGHAGALVISPYVMLI